MEEEDLYGFHCSVVGDSEQLQSSVAPPLPSEETLKARIIRAKIGSHPLYPKLLDAYIDCQKVGASLEMVEVLDEIGEHNSAADDDDDARLFWGADPELDDFMETYCNLLVKLKSELSRTFDEATAILKDIETQLNSLCVCDGSSVLRNNTTEFVRDGSAPRTIPCPALFTGSSEDDFLNTRGEENETIGWKRINEDRELKDKLLLKYNGYISNLKHQFSKNKKKEKLPKEARQILLAWWNIHLNWPYPTERDKVALAEWSGLDQKQINNWFINRRKRHWKPTVEMQASLLDALYGPPSDP